MFRSEHLLQQRYSDSCYSELNVPSVDVEPKIFDDLVCRSLLCSKTVETESDAGYFVVKLLYTTDNTKTHLLFTVMCSV